MIIEKSPKYYSKVLLFGEYALMSGSMALSIPYSKFYGQLLFDPNSVNKKSTHYSVKYLTDYLSFLMENNFAQNLDLEAFNTDIQNGLYFGCNIPISYGLGSSGAIVASVFQAYKKDNIVNEFGSMKKYFGKMESYYHGQSSGLDPLVSYFNHPILVSSDGNVNTTKVSLSDTQGTGGIFLLDTETTGETQPLVSWYIEEMKKNEFRNKIENILIPNNNTCINDMLDGKTYTWLHHVKTLSQFTYDNFRKMIPDKIHEIWKSGIESGNYYLKLCGSGGGGMMLGFTYNLEKATEELSNYKLHIIE